ncbi:hypothetical protein [Mesoplasma florum]|nr:hypothetical protein [Mesoplasma florum]
MTEKHLYDYSCGCVECSKIKVLITLNNNVSSLDRKIENLNSTIRNKR